MDEFLAALGSAVSLAVLEGRERCFVNCVLFLSDLVRVGVLDAVPFAALIGSIIAAPSKFNT
jgi:hypothetical protein